MRWDGGTDLSAGICRSFWKPKRSPRPLQGSEDRAEVKGHSGHPCPGAAVPAEPHSTWGPGNSLWGSISGSALVVAVCRGDFPLALGWALGTASTRAGGRCCLLKA